MIFLYELKKLLLAPAVIGFIVLCLGLNAAVAASLYKPEEMPPTTEPQNVFEGYSAGEQGEWYITKYHIPEKDAQNIRAKYAKLQPVIDAKAANGDARSYYFGEYTRQYHEILFSIVLRLIIAEGCVLALFLALLSSGFENISGTEMTAYSSKIGRRIYVPKLAANVMAAVVCLAVLLAVSLMIFLARFDFSGVWGDNVSSGFNGAVGHYGLPFTTWRSFTVGGYFAAAIGAAFGLAVVFVLFGFAVGLFLRNSYAAIVTAIIALAVLFLLFNASPVGSVLRGVLGLTPVPLILQSPAWFTEGGENVIWANFETIGLAATLAVTAAMTILAAKIFKKRELL
ncbi:MAG: hypothetical protein LBT12_00820 [Oscillospiraceae bacterium]|jgi:hypothetical protein|nr:hypothetical protein [Oscillospiraceae bacterium]